MESPKTQSELEKEAKVYQVEAIGQRVKSLENILPGLDAKLDKLIQNQITVQQLSDLNKSFEEKLQNAIKSVHLEYGPLKKNASKFTWLIIAGAVAIIEQLAVGYEILFRK